MGKITVKHYLNKRLKPDNNGNDKIYPLYLSILYDRMSIRTPSAINAIWEDLTEKDFENKKFRKELLFKMKYEINLIERSVKKFIEDENVRQLRKDLGKVYPGKKYRSKNERLNILNTYIDYYTHSIFDVVSNELLKRIRNAVLNKLSNNFNELDLFDEYKLQDLFYYNNPVLYNIIVKYNLGKEYELYFIIWSRFHDYLSVQGKKYGYDMPYIDWIEGKGQKLFAEYLKTYTRHTDKWEKNFFTDEKILTSINIINEIINSHDYFDKLINRF
ncbi:hypothetical protein [Daejeonia sp. YH14]|uniref:hypothetical protein n=1 Tax=Daejeonia sp. YH14 TaxID=3439042 RepID=UPI003F49374D